jgi:hypothetical protein
MARKPERLERNLRDVFWGGDRELAARVARVCVLFEDLRIEYHGARTEAEMPLDGLSKAYRRFYFLRRSLVTLDEFCGALNRLNAIDDWRIHVESPTDRHRRQMWVDAVKFFNAKKRRIETIRGDIGGHYSENAATWAVNRFQAGTTGIFEIVYGEQTADAKLHFSTELVASVVLRTAGEQPLSDNEMTSYIQSVFDDVTDGWTHAVNAVHVVVGEYLAPRFRRK